MPKGKVIHTSKLTCEHVTKMKGGREQVSFSTDKNDPFFANGERPGGFNLNVSNTKGQGKFEPGNTYDLQFVHTGEAEEEASPE